MSDPDNEARDVEERSDNYDDRPTIVCLCGSTRFADAYATAYREESLAGKIVLSVGVMIHTGDLPIRHDGPEKRLLDELHLRKIDLADEVLVLNVGGYIGESTARELAYARQHGKHIRMLEDDGAAYRGRDLRTASQ